MSQTLSIVIEVEDGVDILNDERVQDFVDSIQDVAVRTFVTLRPVPPTSK